MMNKKTITWMSVFFYICGFFLLGRLLWVQIADHEEMTVLADQQQVKKIDVEEAVRGSIFDRNGIPITNQEEKPALLIFPSLVHDVDATVKEVATIINIEEKSLKKRIVGENSSGEEIRYVPFYAKTDLSIEEEESIKALDATGLFILGKQGRHYNDAPLLHLLGEVGAVTKDDVLKKTIPADYSEGDFIGTSGLERVYEDILRGKGGKGFGVVVDDKKRAVSNGDYYVFEEEKVEGGSVHLTIDLSIQRGAESALEGVNGAAVVLDAKNGDVLAMASSPKYDPLHINSAQGKDAYVNKALKSYPPASLFKIFIAAVGLEEGVVQKETPFLCNGSYTLDNGRVIRCWNEKGHGIMTFQDALSKSCNPVFINLGQKLNPAAIESAFKKWELNRDILLGYPLGNLSAMDLGGKTSGEIANAVLGEDGVAMTPLNLGKMMNVIASGGYLQAPRLVKEVYDTNGEIVKKIPESLSSRVLSKKTAAEIKKMLKKTFLTGTGASLGLENLNLAGKTGTSETGNVWIGGFFPDDDPKYTIVILVENGSSGVSDGGPVLKKLCGYLNAQ